MAKDFGPINWDFEERKMQIKREINTIITQIDNLETQKEKYIQAKDNGTQASTELQNAKQNICISKEALERTYNGKSAILYGKKMDEEVKNINEMLRILNNILIPEIDKNIEKIEREIEEKRSKKKRLEMELYILNK